MVNRKRGDSVFILLHVLQGLPWLSFHWSRIGDFPHQSRLALGLNQPPVQWLTVLFPGGVNRPGRGFDHPLAFSAEVNAKSSPIHLNTSRLSWPVLGWNLPLTWILRKGLYFIVCFSSLFPSRSLCLSPTPPLSYSMQTWSHDIQDLLYKFPLQRVII